MLSMRCTAQDSAFSRGRIPSHDKQLLMDLLVLQQMAEEVSFAIRRHVRQAGLPYYFWKAVQNDLLVCYNLP
jgi:hypothetical protein